nr:hypothetical protein [Tanacetum cinerariifolium]
YLADATCGYWKKKRKGERFLSLKSRSRHSNRHLGSKEAEPATCCTEQSLFNVVYSAFSAAVEVEEERIKLDEVVVNSKVQSKDDLNYSIELTKVVEELGVMSEKYKEMDKKLEEAVETEDFERTERVSNGLTSAERDRERFLVVVWEVIAECDAVEVKMQKALETQIVME